MLMILLVVASVFAGGFADVADSNGNFPPLIERMITDIVDHHVEDLLPEDKKDRKIVVDFVKKSADYEYNLLKAELDAAAAREELRRIDDDLDYITRRYGQLTNRKREVQQILNKALAIMQESDSNSVMAQ